MKSKPSIGLISPLSMGALLLATFLGLDFLAMPREVILFGGQSGYWAVAVSAVLASIMAILVTEFQKRFPGESLLRAARSVLGRPVAFIGNIGFLSVFFIWLVFAVRDAMDLVLIYLLNRTPLWAASALFLLSVAYVAVNGLTAVIRLACFVIIPGAAIRLIMQLIAFQGASVSHLLPVFGEKPVGYIVGGLAVLNAFLPLATILLSHPRLSQKEKMRPILFLPILIAAVIFAIGVVGTIAVFGADYTLQFNWSNLAAIGRVSIPYLVIEQLGLVFLIIWIILFFVSVAYYTYLVAHGAQTLSPRIPYAWATAVILFTVWLGGLLFPNTPEVHNAFDVYRRWASLPAFAYPLIIYTVSLIRGIKGEQQ